MLTSNQKAKLVKIHGVLCDVDGDTEPAPNASGEGREV